MEEGQYRDTPLGTPQGGVISPLLANIYLHALDERWMREHAHLGMLVRYADDFVVMCDSARACEEAEQRIREILDEPCAWIAAVKKSRWSWPKASQRPDSGEVRQAPLLPPALACQAQHEEDPGTG